MLNLQTNLRWIYHVCVVSMRLPHWSVDGWLIIVSQPVPLNERLIIFHWPVMAWQSGVAGIFLTGGSSVPVSWFAWCYKKAPCLAGLPGQCYGSEVTRCLATRFLGLEAAWSKVVCQSGTSRPGLGLGAEKIWSAHTVFFYDIQNWIIFFPMYQKHFFTTIRKQFFFTLMFMLY